MDTHAHFARAVRRLNPLPGQRREWAEHDAAVTGHLAASAAIDASTTWLITAHEAGRHDADLFFSKGTTSADQ